MSKKNVTIDDLKNSVLKFLRVANRYRGIVFFIVLACIYGYIILRINVLSSAPPAQADIDAAEKTAAASPKIDAEAAAAINRLKDNSVRVQSIFEEARNNPFNE